MPSSSGTKKEREKEKAALKRLEKQVKLTREFLGSGNFGVVYLGRLGAEPVAVKVIKEVSEEDQRKLGGKSAKEREAELVHEAFIQSQLDHPRIVRILAVSFSQRPHTIALEYSSLSLLPSKTTKPQKKEELNNLKDFNYSPCVSLFPSWFLLFFF
jgi:serine/threonine protein kinase